MKNYSTNTGAKRLIKLVLMCFLFMNFTPLKADVKCAQNDHITVDFKNMELKQVFNWITQQVGYNFFYEASEIDIEKKVSIQATDTCIEDFLVKLFSKIELDHRIVAKQVVVKPQRIDNFVPKAKVKTKPSPNNPQQATLTGTIVDDAGIPLPGASIVAKG
ncbi:MAG: STN and carboxypeptidase regulatory-like domain-containing protein, partial [Bacteroidota bacterium]